MPEQAEIEQQARELGWVPQEEFKGDPSKWIGADEFVERGTHLMPILNATNKRLKDEVSSMRSQLASVQEALRTSQETIAALDEYHAQDVKAKVEKARKELKEEMRLASERGDHAAVVELTEELTNLNAEERKNKAERDGRPSPKAAPNSVDWTKNPEFIAWQQDNSWYGSDLTRTSLAQTISYQLRMADPDATKLKGRAFLDKVTEGVEAEIAKLTGQRPNKVESGGPSGGSTGKVKGKTYNDMPAEAKQACDSFEAALVGPNKKYKTVKEWRDKYATDFFA